MLNYFIICLIFLMGLYFYLKMNTPGLLENFSSNNCPDQLIQKGNQIYLKNTKLARIPGVNPIRFENLEDYVEFLNWQRSQGTNCPVLKLDQSFSNQKELNYNIEKPCKKSNFQLLMDASRNDPPFNKNLYPGFDPLNQYIGVDTPLDSLYREESPYSANAMDKNWSGRKYSQKLTKSDYYNENK